MAVIVFSVGGADTRDQGIKEMSFFALKTFIKKWKAFIFSLS